MYPSGAGRDDGPVESFAVVTAEIGIRLPVGVTWRGVSWRSSSKWPHDTVAGPDPDA